MVELILVISITGAVAAIAVPRYAASLTRYRVNMASQRIVDELNHARESARSTSSPVTVYLGPRDESIRIVGAGSLAHPSANESSVVYKEAPYQVDLEVTLADSSLATSQVTLTFDGFGMADQDLSITIKGGGYERIVDVKTTNPEVTRR